MTLVVVIFAGCASKREAGINEATLRVVELDRAQPEVTRTARDYAFRR
jgi:hypothetical protein